MRPIPQACSIRGIVLDDFAHRLAIELEQRYSEASNPAELFGRNKRPAIGGSAQDTRDRERTRAPAHVHGERTWQVHPCPQLLFEPTDPHRRTPGLCEVTSCCSLCPSFCCSAVFLPGTGPCRYRGPA